MILYGPNTGVSAKEFQDMNLNTGLRIYVKFRIVLQSADCQ